MVGLGKWIATALMMVILGGPAVASAGMTTREAPAEISRSATKPGDEPPVTDAEQYSQRENQSKNLERFKGGGAGIYIGGSTIAVVALVILLIILL